MKPSINSENSKEESYNLEEASNSNSGRFSENFNAFQRRPIDVDLESESAESEESDDDSYFYTDSEVDNFNIKQKYLEEKKRKGRCILKHNAIFRLRWDLFIMILAIYNCVSIPFNAAFTPESNIYYTIFDRLIDVLFATDVVINFRTSYVHPKTGLEVVDAKSIAKNYIFGGRFWIDLLASIPFETLYTLLIPGTGNGTLELLGLLKLVRLLRLGRVIRYMKFKTGLKIGIRIIQLLFFLLLIVHWIG